MTPSQAAAPGRVRSGRIFVTPLEHFTVRNEYRHALWFPFMHELGGVHVGVASDQNSTLLAAARSEFAFLVGIDRQVVDLHRIYATLIAAAGERSHGRNQTARRCCRRPSPPGQSSARLAG